MAQTSTKNAKELSYCADAGINDDEEDGCASEKPRLQIAKSQEYKEHGSQEMILEYSCVSPIKVCQNKLSERGIIVHKAILRSFAERGQPLKREEISLMYPTEDVIAILKTLQQNDLAVLNDEGELIGAYPFTQVDTPHTLLINGQTLHAMCSFDALGVSAMFGVEVDIHSRCHLSQDSIHIKMLNKKVIKVNYPELRVGIPKKSSKGCAARNLCPEMIFLRDAKIADDWVAEKVDILLLLSLQEAIELSAFYFVPLVSDEKLITTSVEHLAKIQEYMTQLSCCLHSSENEEK